MRVEEPLVLISCDERPAKRVRGCSVVRAETPAPAEVGYALSSGRHADLIDRSGVQSNLLSLILTQNMAKHSLKRRISPRFLEDRRRASVRSVRARKIGKINFELRQWRQLERELGAASQFDWPLDPHPHMPQPFPFDRRRRLLTTGVLKQRDERATFMTR